MLQVPFGTWGNLATDASCAAVRGSTIRTTRARLTATTTIQTTVTTTSVSGWWCASFHTLSLSYTKGVTVRLVQSWRLNQSGCRSPSPRFPHSPAWPTGCWRGAGRLPYHRQCASSLCLPAIVPSGTRLQDAVREDDEMAQVCPVCT